MVPDIQPNSKAQPATGSLLWTEYGLNHFIFITQLSSDRSQVFDPQAFGLENEMGKEMIVEEYSADLQNIVWVLIIWARELEFITK